MNYIIKDEINILYEINKAFVYLANEDEEIKKLNESLSKIDIDKEKYKKNNLKSFYKFIEKFKKINTVPLDDIKFYFSEINDGINESYLSIYEIFLSNFNTDELISLKNLIENLSEEEVKEFSLKEVIKFIIETFDDKTLNLSMSKQDFLKYLISSKDFSYEAKWKLTVLLEDSKNFLLKYFNILINSIYDLKNLFMIFEKDKNKFISDFKKELNKNENFLTELGSFKIDESTSLIIYPSIIDFRKILLLESTSPLIEINEVNVCYLGYKFQELLTLSQGKKNEEEILLEKLKCISDKSKYEILKILNNKPMYGQQIAQKLNLTTATISYHMNTLALNKLVTINKIDNKVYYHLNKEEVSKICNLLQKNFN